MLKDINQAQPKEEQLDEKILEEYVNSLPPRKEDDDSEDTSSEDTESAETYLDDDLPF